MMSKEAEERALLIISGNMKRTIDVYIVFVGEESEMQYAKIGYSKEAGIRLRGIRVGCPLPIVEIRAFECNSVPEARAAERHLHAELHDLRTVGEWFRCSDVPRILACLEMAAVKFGCTSKVRRVDPEFSERRARKVKRLIRGFNERMGHFS